MIFVFSRLAKKIGAIIVKEIQSQILSAKENITKDLKDHIDSTVDKAVHEIRSEVDYNKRETITELTTFIRNEKENK